METVDKNIKKGGIFMFTCFDVTRVKNLLKDTVINEEYSFNVPQAPSINTLPQNRYNNNTEYELNKYNCEYY